MEDFNEILDTALNSIIQDSNFSDALNRIVHDISGTGVRLDIEAHTVPVPTNEQDNEEEVHDTSGEAEAAANNTPILSTNNEFNMNPRRIDAIQLYSQYLRHVYNYEDTIRSYNDNITVMNRTLNFMTRNILDGNRRMSVPISMASSPHILSPPVTTNGITFPWSWTPSQPFRIPTQTDNSGINHNHALNLSRMMSTTRTFVYNSTMELVSNQCPISFENFENGDILCEIIHCHHVFKHSHINNWFSQNSRCPVCRHDLSIETDSS